MVTVARLAPPLLAVIALAACSQSESGDEGASPPASGQVAAPTPDHEASPTPTETTERRPATPTPEPDEGGTPRPTSPPTPVTPSPEPTPTAGPERPDWLGTRELPELADGIGVPQETPEELRDRRLPPRPHLPPPDDDAFSAEVAPVPDDVVARSSWSPACPVDLEELRYVTMTFWGFDDRAHTGEMIVHASVAGDVVGAFERLFEARFPIEEMRVLSADDLDAPPTGDGNVTSGFECRRVTGGERWSDHALGTAIDVNPFHNPYVRGEVVVPELAEAYLDRDDRRPGMIHDGDVVTEAFAGIGWGWGGQWESLKDWMHFSASGR